MDVPRLVPLTLLPDISDILYSDVIEEMFGSPTRTFESNLQRIGQRQNQNRYYCK